MLLFVLTKNSFSLSSSSSSFVAVTFFLLRNLSDKHSPAIHLVNWINSFTAFFCPHFRLFLLYGHKSQAEDCYLMKSSIPRNAKKYEQARFLSSVSNPWTSCLFSTTSSNCLRNTGKFLSSWNSLLQWIGRIIERKYQQFVSLWNL